MPFRHIVLLTLQADADIPATLQALGELPSSIDTLRRYTFGPDAGLADGNATIGVVADFEDQAGYETYRDHPAHQAFLATYIRPHLLHRAALQHDVPVQ